MVIRDTILEQQAAQIKDLTNTIKSQSEAITELQATIAELNDRIKELQEQLGQNSQNSSRPPSSDSFGKGSKGNRTPSGRKPGGQKGIGINILWDSQFVYSEFQDHG